MNDKLIQERIDDFVKKDKRINSEILQEISLYLYSSEFPDLDVYTLAKKFDTDTLFELVSYADGEPIYLPPKIEFRNNY